MRGIFLEEEVMASFYAAMLLDPKLNRQYQKYISKAKKAERDTSAAIRDHLKVKMWKLRTKRESSSPPNK